MNSAFSFTPFFSFTSSTCWGVSSATGDGKECSQCRAWQTHIHINVSLTQSQYMHGLGIQDGRCDVILIQKILVLSSRCMWISLAIHDIIIYNMIISQCTYRKRISFFGLFAWLEWSCADAWSCRWERNTARTTPTRVPWTYQVTTEHCNFNSNIKARTAFQLWQHNVLIYYKNSNDNNDNDTNNNNDITHTITIIMTL